MESPVRRLWLHATAIAGLSVALFLASCSSSNDVAVNPTANNDEVAATLMVSNQPIEQWQSEDNEVLPLNPRWEIVMAVRMAECHLLIQRVGGVRFRFPA